MAEYIDKQAAIDALTERNLVVHMDSVNNGLVASCHRSAQRIIANIPAADVRPVVLCRDCKHWARIKQDCILASCDLDALVRCEDFYCANGERRKHE